jgi:hypothetical protein
MYNWLELKKEEWKKIIEDTKELGVMDTKLLDTMSALIDGIKVRESDKNKKA